MTKDDRDILEILKDELNFVEKGGYGRAVRTPRAPTIAFQDSLSCLEFPTHRHDDGCALMRFVPPEHRSECVPCHYIPLNRAGETAVALDACGDQQKLEEALKGWLKSTITQIEQERAERLPA
jgi:hypothetical protein